MELHLSYRKKKRVGTRAAGRSQLSSTCVRLGERCNPPNPQPIYIAATNFFNFFVFRRNFRDLDKGPPLNLERSHQDTRIRWQKNNINNNYQKKPKQTKKKPWMTFRGDSLSLNQGERTQTKIVFLEKYLLRYLILDASLAFT